MTDIQIHRSSRGNVPRGHNRWLRAAINAAVRPNSKGAKLYRSRTIVADVFSKTVPVDSIYRHIDSYRSKTKFYTCSTYCAAMVAQLEVSSAGLMDYLSGSAAPIPTRWGYSVVPDHALKITNKDLTRSVTCQCCGTTIKSK